MVAIEATAIERLTIRDAAAGLALSREARWNQTLDDWRRFLRKGSTFGVRDGEGRLIATAALLPAPPVTWISMVLVMRDWRRRGLANRLMQHCIKEAERCALTPLLDATPEGAAVYGAMGFAETGFGLQRWRRTNIAAMHMPPGTQSNVDLRALCAEDQEAMGFDRSDLLVELATRDGSAIARHENALALMRDGDRARHIGPVFAGSNEQASDLLERIAASEQGSLLVDLSSDHRDLGIFLESRGFVFERPFARMSLARMPVGARNAPAPNKRLIAAAGPEFG